VAVWDPTDTGHQARGKQVQEPGGIWYTPTTGIWQTVWLEPVSESRIESLRITPELDEEAVTVQVNAWGEVGSVALEVTVLDGEEEVGQGAIVMESEGREPGRMMPRIRLAVPEAKTWSPGSPFLYDLRVRLLRDGQTVDEVGSYFGMRKIALGVDEGGGSASS